MSVYVAPDALDDRDREILVRRAVSLGDAGTPAVGDYVTFADGTVRRVSHVWQGCADDGSDSVQTSDEYAGHYYLGDGYVSYSGSLYPGIPASTFTDTGDVRDGPVWFFHHDYSRAHNGVDTVTAFRVWTTSREANR